MSFMKSISYIAIALFFFILGCSSSNDIIVSPTGGWYDYLGVETFIAWTTYADGYSVRIDPESLYLGHVDALGYMFPFNER